MDQHSIIEILLKVQFNTIILIQVLAYKNFKTFHFNQLDREKNVVTYINTIRIL